MRFVLALLTAAAILIHPAPGWSQSLSEVHIAIERIGLKPGAMATIGANTYLLQRVTIHHPKRNVWTVKLTAIPIKIIIPEYHRSM